MAVGDFTLLRTAQSSGAGTTVTTLAFSVTAGDVLLVVAGYGGTNQAVSSFSSSFAVVSPWSITDQDIAGSSPFVGGALGYAVADATDVSATVTMTMVGTNSLREIQVFKVGANGVTTEPTNFITSIQTTDLTPTATLPATPESTSKLLAHSIWNDPAGDSSTAPGTGWTEVPSSEVVLGANNAIAQSQQADGSNGANADWTYTLGSGTIVQQALVVVEVKEAAAPGGVPLAVLNSNDRRRR